MRGRKKYISARGSAGGGNEQKEVTDIICIQKEVKHKVREWNMGQEVYTCCFYAAGSHISCIQVASVLVRCLMRGGVCVGVRGEACLLKTELN